MTNLTSPPIFARNVPKNATNQPDGTSKPNKSDADLEKDSDDFKKHLEEADEERNLEEGVIAPALLLPGQQNMINNLLNKENASIEGITDAMADSQVETSSEKNRLLAGNATIEGTNKPSETGVKANMAELETMLNKISAPEGNVGKEMSFVLKNTPFSGSKFTLQISDVNLNASMVMPNSVNPTAALEASELMRNRLALTFPDLDVNITTRWERDDDNQDQGRQKGSDDSEDDELII